MHLNLGHLLSEAVHDEVGDLYRQLEALLLPRMALFLNEVKSLPLLLDSLSVPLVDLGLDHPVWQGRPVVRGVGVFLHWYRLLVLVSTVRGGLRKEGFVRLWGRPHFALACRTYFLRKFRLHEARHFACLPLAQVVYLETQVYVHPGTRVVLLDRT